MQKNDVITDGENVFRVLAVYGDMVSIIDCQGNRLPITVVAESVADYTLVNEPLREYDTWNSLKPSEQKICRERYRLFSDILPFVYNENLCSQLLKANAEKFDCSATKIKKYLIAYLIEQNIMALAPKRNAKEKELTVDEKNMRWALNKTVFSPKKYNLTDSYTYLLKEKYTDAEGQLLDSYPSLWQYRYFYRKYKTMQNYLISRNGLSSYKRNNRPLLGDGVQDIAPTIGTFMLDSTVCDIYLIDNVGRVVGRPVLTVAVDANSSMCTAYLLTWEGGVYSLKGLFVNMISDKLEHCRKFGIAIDKSMWDCHYMGSKIISDRGSEYLTADIEQLSELGVEIINCEAYRADLKGVVEKLFDLVQSSFKPSLYGKGVIQEDFQERGAEDYRKQAQLTLKDFEQIVLRCIIYYNNNRIIDNYHYSDDMIKNHVKPYAAAIWNYLLGENADALISVSKEQLLMTLLKRTSGRFARNGLIVNHMRYRHMIGNYTNKYLSGGEAVVAYNSDNVNVVWLFENGEYVPFELIEKRFKGKSLKESDDMRQAVKEIVEAERENNLQAKVNLVNHIDAVANKKTSKKHSQIKNIRQTRANERDKEHKDFMENIKDGK